MKQHQDRFPVEAKRVEPGILPELQSRRHCGTRSLPDIGSTAILFAEIGSTMHKRSAAIALMFCSTKFNVEKTFAPPP
jgi:hypothetical protein